MVQRDQGWLLEGGLFTICYWDVSKEWHEGKNTVSHSFPYRSCLSSHQCFLSHLQSKFHFLNDLEVAVGLVIPFRRLLPNSMFDFNWTNLSFSGLRQPWWLRLIQEPPPLVSGLEVFAWFTIWNKLRWCCHCYFIWITSASSLFKGLSLGKWKVDICVSPYY